MNKEKKRKFIRVISIILILIGCGYIGKEYYNRAQSKKAVEAEQNISNSIADELGLDQKQKDKEKEKKAANEYIEKMQKEMNNEDIIGRLEFKKLGLDHLLVHSKDNNEYLNLNVKKEWFYTGSIFLDKYNKDDFSDFNSRIYGHRILDGTFFGSFKYFLDQEFVDKKKEENFFKLTTKDGIKYYDIIAVLDVTPEMENLPTNFSQEFIDSLDKNSVVKINSTNRKITSEDHLVSLVSCKPMGITHSTRRIVIIGLERNE